MNYIKLILVALGGMLTPGTTAGAEIVSYLLAIISAALTNLNTKTKETISKVLAIATTCLSWLHKVKNWIPEKWQKAYEETIEAVEAVVSALADFKVTDEEFENIKREFEEARAAWESDDDEETDDDSVADKK